jgi:V8-like Glu-specific endopeptidase
VGGGIVKYTTHTLPGSSGAPVFNERWEVVALHARGGNEVGLRMFANEGILIKKVIGALDLQL